MLYNYFWGILFNIKKSYDQTDTPPHNDCLTGDVHSKYLPLVCFSGNDMEPIYYILLNFRRLDFRPSNLFQVRLELKRDLIDHLLSIDKYWRPYPISWHNPTFIYKPRNHSHLRQWKKRCTHLLYHVHCCIQDLCHGRKQSSHSRPGFVPMRGLIRSPS